MLTFIIKIVICDFWTVLPPTTLKGFTRRNMINVSKHKNLNIFFIYLYFEYVSDIWGKEGIDPRYESIMLIDLYSEYLPLPSPVSRLLCIVVI